MKLFPIHISFITGIHQMTFLEKHLWGTVFAITEKIYLTKDGNKNVIGASISASIWKIILKNIY